MKLLKNIIEEVFLVDIDTNSRERKFVDARRVYCKIMKDFGFTYQHIAFTINKNHATAIHYVKSLDFIMDYDLNLKNKYNLAKKFFVLKNNELKITSSNDLYLNLISLSNKLNEIYIIKNYLKERLDSYLTSENDLTDKNIEDLKSILSPILDNKVEYNESRTEQS